ncbi:MAG TPA: hypothetical protein VFW31_01515 [Candidatus Angelobacter sp.]|nr:hypothetical protein [Candidatus Angelobacter sp.]
MTRLEAALNQIGGSGGFTPPGGAVVDPPPWHYRWPHPVADPAPWPHPVADPAPYPWYGGGVFRRPIPVPSPIVDSATFAAGGGGVPSPFGAQAASAQSLFARIGHLGGDPPPPDISRFSAVQLEATLHSIAAEKARLTSMENMVKQQLENVKKQG